MKSITTSFCVANVEMEWGTTLPMAMDRLQHLPQQPMNDPGVRVQVAQAYGLPTLCAELTAPAVGRPIMLATYALAVDGQNTVERLPAHITGFLGEPYQLERESAADYSDPSNCVVLWGRWRWHDVHIDLSLFGGPRMEEEGKSVGLLYVAWGNEIAAAQPFVAEQLKREQVFSELAQQIADIRRYTLQFEQSSSMPVDDEGAELSAELRRARICLGGKQIFQTPTAIARKLDDREVALWKVRDGKTWGVSNKWDTLVFAAATRVDVVWVNLLPAKGGGMSSIEIGEMTLRSIDSCPVMQEIAEALRGMLGVNVRFDESYNV
jgi:hypothetical protein